MTSYTIGALAEAAGVRRDTIRYYERSGLLRAPDRTAANYRVYGEGDLQRVLFIRKAQTLGFALGEISQLLALKASDAGKASDVLRLTLDKIRQEEARIAQLLAIRDALHNLAAKCPGDAPASDCPILAHIAGAGRLTPTE